MNAPPAAVPNIMPRFRDNASKLLINPKWLGSTRPITRLVLGEVIIPMDTPSKTINVINRNIGYEEERKPKATNVPDIANNPAVNRGKEPCLSDKLPNNGEATIQASVFPIIYNNIIIISRTRTGDRR
ncbi:hypothetical protein BCV73_33840 [Paenibacillus sp. SSG-1]|nr:hypothetical protein BCV73_33840 [Paenibacillus sp. SSG-1]